MNDDLANVDVSPTPTSMGTSLRVLDDGSADVLIGEAEVVVWRPRSVDRVGWAWLASFGEGPSREYVKPAEDAHYESRDVAIRAAVDAVMRTAQARANRWLAVVEHARALGAPVDARPAAAAEADVLRRRLVLLQSENLALERERDEVASDCRCWRELAEDLRDASALLAPEFVQRFEQIAER